MMNKFCGHMSILVSCSILHNIVCAQSAVTVYGVVDVGIASESGSSTGGSILKLDSGQQTQSRIGFKGKEELGDGLSANFVLESGLNAATGAYVERNLSFSSQVWVGLSGAFGSIKMGRQFTPYFGAVATSDPFDATGPADATRLLASSGYRMNNSIKYSLPYMSGWYADLAYGFGEIAGNTAANRQVSLAVGYAQGPLDIKLAHHDARDVTGNTSVRNTLIGGSYDLGKVKCWLAYGMNTDSMLLDTRDTLIGVSAPFGQSSIAADYIRKTDKQQANSDARQRAFSYYYNFSSRTNFYATYSRLSNDIAASYSVAIPGTTDRILALGIRHKF